MYKSVLVTSKGDNMYRLYCALCSVVHVLKDGIVTVQLYMHWQYIFHKLSIIQALLCVFVFRQTHGYSSC